MGLNGERVRIAGCPEIDAQEESADHKLPMKGSVPSPEEKVTAKERHGLNRDESSSHPTT